MALRPPAVALIGTFDVDNYGDHLFVGVARRELSRRIPGLQVDAFSPLGWLHPTRLDGGQRVRPLGPRTQARLDAFADGYDAIVVGGGELLHLNDPLLANFYGTTPSVMAGIAPSAWFLEGLGFERERRCPVLWNGVGIPFDFSTADAARVRKAVAGRSWLSVRDPHSRRRLTEAGVVGEIEVVPDSALLIDRILPRADLAERLVRLRSTGQYPVGPALVVQGCDLLLDHARHIGDVLVRLQAEEHVEIALVETGRCRADGEFADALSTNLEARSGRRPCRLGADAAVDDIAAALFGAAAVIGSSLHAAVTAVAYERPFVTLNLGAESKLDGFGVQTGLSKHVIDDVGDLWAALVSARTSPPPAGTVARLHQELDGHFDRLAEAILASVEGGGHRGLRPMADDDAVLALIEEADADRGAAVARAERAESAAAAALVEHDALLATRTFRFTSHARRMYRRARSRRLPRASG